MGTQINEVDLVKYLEVELIVATVGCTVNSEDCILCLSDICDDSVESFEVSESGGDIGSS